MAKEDLESAESDMFEWTWKIAVAKLTGSRQRVIWALMPAWRSRMKVTARGRLRNGRARIDPYNAVQIQKAASAYFTSKQIRPFGFARPSRASLVTGD